MLSRPGEAIYNDANGAPEGNHFFQVVWLPDERTRGLSQATPRPGKTTKADPGAHPDCLRGGCTGRSGAKPDVARAARRPSLARFASFDPGLEWGDAISIKRSSTSALFRRLGRTIYLIVGQNDDAAIGVMISTLLSLAAQYPVAASGTVRSGARFFVLDGTPEDHPSSGVLAKVAGVLPHGRRRWRLA